MRYRGQMAQSSRATVVQEARKTRIADQLACPQQLRGRTVMIETKYSISAVPETDSPPVGETPRGPNRRKILGQIGAAATAAGALASPSMSSAQTVGSSSNSSGVGAPPAGVTNRRVMEAMQLRVAEAVDDAKVRAATNRDNGDEARYPNKGGTYTKGLPHDQYGRVDLNAYQIFKRALNSGDPSDFAAIPMGGTRTLNGPQAGLAFCLVALDNARSSRASPRCRGRLASPRPSAGSTGTENTAIPRS